MKVDGAACRVKGQTSNFKAFGSPPFNLTPVTFWAGQEAVNYLAVPGTT